MGGRRNVLFVTADQWRGDCLGVAGHTVVTTPTLDRLAGEGVRFRRHHANTAPCGPSRATLYTGLYARNHRSVLNGTPLDHRLTNVALEARAAGHDPVLFGYTDTSLDPTVLDPGDPRLTTYEAVLPGFRAVVDFPFGTLDPWLSHLVEQGYDVDLDDPHSIWEGVTPGQPARYAAEHSETAFLTDAALEWLEGEVAADRSWFVHLSYLRPHPPHLVAAPYHALVDPDDVPPPRRAATRELEAAQHPLTALALDLPGIAAPGDDAEGRQTQATYYGMMREVDDHLGRVIDWLDASGEAANTLVIVTSDHGDQMGDHWLFEKLGFWDESYHVPMIIRDPSADPSVAGRVVDRFTEHVDVMPTILEWLDLEVPISCDGRSLSPFLGAAATSEVPAPAEWRDATVWEWDFRSPAHHVAEDLLGITMEECCLTVVRDEHYKYVHFAPDSLPNLLFDLAADPDQLDDRAAAPEYAPIVAEYAGKLLSWHMRHADRHLTGTELTRRGPVVRRDPRR